MRLTYIHNAEIPANGASTVQVMRMCAAFTRAGHDVELIVPLVTKLVAPSDDELFDYYGCGDRFSVRHQRQRFGGVIEFAIKAALHARERRSDIVYGRCIRSCGFAALLGLPVVHEAHGPVEAYSKSGSFVFRQLAKFSRFRRLVTINGALADYYAALLPQLSRPPHVAPSGTDPVEQTVPLAQPAAGGQLRVGYVGSLFPGKGMELIAELAKRTSYRFVVAGGDAETIAHWKQELGDRVEFLGHVPNRDVSALIRTFDVALAPYLENVGGLSVTFNLAAWMSPLKLFEYMAHGKAILVSDLPAIREVVRDGEEVLLCSPRDAGDWILALDRLAQDPELRERLGRNALSTFLRRFTWDQRAAGILEAIAV